MDSMRGLNTALPRASPPKQVTPPEQLLQAFKDAALSVTKLYKTAAADQAKTRAEGFQDCLDELLTFMDKEDLGISDGEGWKIRQWATARLDGREPVVDSDEETEKERASSPVLQRKPSTSDQEMPVHAEPAPVEIQEPIIEEPEPTPTMALPVLPPSGNFSFRSDVSYPQDADMHMGDEASNQQTTLTSTLVGNGSNTVTFARPNRGNGGRPRHNRHNTRSNNGRNRESAASVGQKRKINFGEFFDIGDATNPFGGGGKRSRFT